MKHSIRWKLTLFVACVVGLTAASLSVASYVFARRMLRQQIHDRLSIVVADRQKLLLGFIQQQQERVSLVASRTRLRQALDEFAVGQVTNDRFHDETRRILDDALRGSQGCKAIWIANPAGPVVTATDDAYLGQDQAILPDFIEGRKAAQVRFFRDKDGRDEAVLSAPALIWPDRLVGVVMMLVDAEPIMDLLGDRTGLGQSGEVRIGTRAGDKIRYLLFAEGGTQTQEVAPENAPAMAAATTGQTGFTQTRDWRGVQVLAAYRPAGYRDWGIVTKIDVAEAYAPIAWLRHLFVAVELVVFAVGLFFSYLLARRFTKPVLRMAKMAEAIASGEMQARVVVESHDEVGRLGTAFNKMSEELAHSHAVLEDRVRQRTAELAAERDLIQQLMDHSPDRIYFKDRESRFIRANKALAVFFGVSDPGAAIGKTDANFFTQEHAQAALDDEQRIIQTGQPLFSQEERETWPDGHVSWCSSTKAPLRDAAGNIIGTFGISRDITDRKRAEEQLNRYFTLSPDMFCIADYRGYFQRVNLAWTNALGYTSEELRAQPFISFVHPDDRDATVGEFDRILKGARSVQFENRYRCKDGSYRWLQWNAIPAPEEQLIHAVARDVSEHKRAQELLARFADALNKRNQEMQEDVKLAREVHQTFLPAKYPGFPRGVAPERSALQFCHRYLPTSALGGDFFEILPFSDTTTGVFICDVMGHGMRAALVTSIVRGLMDKYRDHAPEPGQFLGDINQALLKNLKTCTTTIFATAAYIVIDAVTGQVRYANAGHPTPFLLRSTGQVEPFEPEALPHAPALGLIRDTVYPVAAHQIGVGDSLLLFTDGLYEVEGRDGSQFGFDRLLQAVAGKAKLQGLQQLDELLMQARRYSANGEFTDDVCLVEVKLASKLAG